MNPSAPPTTKKAPPPITIPTKLSPLITPRHSIEPFPLFKYHVEDQLRHVRMTLNAYATEAKEAVEFGKVDVMHQLLHKLTELDKNNIEWNVKISDETAKNHSDFEQVWFLEDVAQILLILENHSNDLKKYLNDNISLK